MAKLNTPKGKLVRKLGVNIFGNTKFDRLLSKKGYGPGQHGKSGNRFSTYSVQLKEKQKIKKNSKKKKKNKRETKRVNK